MTKTAFFSLLLHRIHTEKHLTYVTKLRNEKLIAHTCTTRSKLPSSLSLPPLSCACICDSHSLAFVRTHPPFLSLTHTHTRICTRARTRIRSHANTCARARPFTLFAINFCPIIARTACPRLALRRRSIRLSRPPCTQFSASNRANFENTILARSPSESVCAIDCLD